MAEAVQTAQTHATGWATAMAARHRTVTHRIAAAVASAVVMAPIIGVTTILAWVCCYMLIIGLERTVVRVSSATDEHGPRGLQGFLYDAILFTSVLTFAWVTIPLWFVAGIYGGLCACIYLGAGMVQSIINGAGSLRITLLTTTPTAVAILATPFMLQQMGATTNEIVAITMACLVFLGICLGAAQRLYRSDHDQRIAYALAESKRAEAEAAVAARTAFLSTIAHDLRTPITAILTGADTLRDTALPQAREELVMIGDAGRMMNSLLNDLLDQARIDAGRLTLNEQAFDLRRMLTQTARLWQDPIRAKGLQLHQDIPQDLPVALLGDEVRLRQVLNNLMSNALKFTSNGAITLRCRCWVDDDDNHALTLEVEDTGHGMQDSQLARLFTPFDQTANDITAQYGGSGLGLSICRDLVRLMDGRLTTRSQPDKGSIFTVALTLEPAEASAVGAVPAALNLPFIPAVTTAEPDLVPDIHPVTITPSVAEPSTGYIAPPVINETTEHAESQDGEVPEDAPLRILIVDDHEINRRAIQLILQSFDCHISMAVDGRSALDICAHSTFDVIFMDVRMPELDGRETTRRLRKSGGPNASTPVIAVTADNAPEDQLACSAAGMTAYLAKPLTPASLIAVLQATLEQAAAQATSQNAA
ncbi:ATP-binding protein [Brevundimonas sp.]|uniref:ATP-binding protein n=1 Tax=Brevundimonas sp. TaxID=1871086 RepID=UPI00289E0F65|nr:ATP-binding protein [Brevundimonas sp.]